MNWYKFSLFDLEMLTTPQIMERGREYFNEGHLKHTCKIDNVLAADITGTNGNYKARLWIRESEILWECSCPFPAFCKHLTALAIAWVERKADFFDLQPTVDNLLHDIPKLQNTCIELIRRNPVNLMDLILFEDPSACASPGFLTSRGIINLMRNIFRSIRLTPADMDTLSERLAGVENMVIELLDRAEPDAIKPLSELLNSLAMAFKDYQSEILVESFSHILSAIEKAPLCFASDQIRILLETLLEIYFDPVLWELGIPMRRVLSKYLEYDMAILEDTLKTKSEDEEDVITLAAVYEIFDMASKDSKFVTEQLGKVIDKLCATSRGYLWLIDRLMDSDLEKAYKLAKKGLTGGFDSASPFRDRLITIHLKRNEPKQAAALSFIQFKDRPNFEEYVKLKSIPGKNPEDFQIYLKQIQELLITANCEELLMRILIDQQDYDGIVKYLPKITAEHSLLLNMAELLSIQTHERFKEIYPVIVHALLKDEDLSNTKTVNALLMAYKKLCFQMEDKTSWEILREQLVHRYQTGLNLSKKTVSILKY